MREALAAARRGLAAGEAPVGACIVANGRILATAHTGVASGPDATAHAEVLAIRDACRHLRSSRLEGCELVVTVEPCPMCLAACHYAGIGVVRFGAELEDFQQASGGELFAPRPAGIEVRGGVLADECRALVAEWARNRSLRAQPRHGASR